MRDFIEYIKDLSFGEIILFVILPVFCICSICSSAYLLVSNQDRIVEAKIEARRQCISKEIFEGRKYIASELPLDSGSELLLRNEHYVVFFQEGNKIIYKKQDNEK